MKRRIVILLLLTLGFLAIMLLRNSRPPVRDLHEVLQNGRLTVLIESGEHGFTRDSLKVAGFQYEIIKQYADHLGVEMVILQEPDHERGAAKLLQNECDIIVSLQPLILDTTKAIISLLPIMHTNLMLVQLPDSLGRLGVQTQYQLDQQIITIPNASPYRKIIERMAHDLAIDPVIQETVYSNIDELLRAVSTGSVAYTVCPEYLINRLAVRYPMVDMSLPLTFHLELGWTTRRNAVVLQENVNAFLCDLIASPHYQLLLEKYFCN